MCDYLSKFPTLESLLGNWIKEEFSSGKSEHILLYYLSKEEPNWKKIESLRQTAIDATNRLIINELQIHHNLLANLDAHLNTLSNEPHLDRFMEHLKKKEDFWQGYSEIETAALFKHHFGSVELEPKLKNCNSVDFSFVFNKMRIFVEVNTPKMGQKFLDVLEKHAVHIGQKPKPFDVPDITNRVKDIILREFEHFDGAEVPSLVIYNLNTSGVHDEDIADRLLGTEYGEFIINNTTGSSSFQWKRKADTVFINDPDLKNLGGIVCYKRDFNINGQIFYYPLHLFGIFFSVSEMEKIGQPFTRVLHT